MSTQWTAYYYVATRYDTMREKTRSFRGDLSKVEVERQMSSFLDLRRKRGESIYPQYDLRQEVAA